MNEVFVMDREEENFKDEKEWFKDACILTKSLLIATKPVIISPGVNKYSLDILTAYVRGIMGKNHSDGALQDEHQLSNRASGVNNIIFTLNDDTRQGLI